MTIGNIYTLRTDTIFQNNTDIFQQIPALLIPVAAGQRIGFSYTVLGTSTPLEPIGIRYQLTPPPNFANMAATAQLYDGLTLTMAQSIVITAGNSIDGPGIQGISSLVINGSLYNGNIAGFLQLQVAQSTSGTRNVSVAVGSHVSFYSL